MATKRRKALFNLPYTHFLADSGSPKIGFWFARSATKFTAGQKIKKSPGEKTREIKQIKIKFFREIAFLAVFPVKKLIFGHF